MSYILLIGLFFIPAFFYQKYFRDSIPIGSFFDLPKYKGQKVYLQGRYSGMEEYWSLKAINGRFNKKLSVELEFKVGPNYIPLKYQSYFDSVYNSYWNKYLLIDAIGIFSSDKEFGYGHLGSNNSLFVVSEIIDIQLYNKITHTKISYTRLQHFTQTIYFLSCKPIQKPP